MRFHRESSRDRYEVVVVGSGIGGLTAAAILARHGVDVLVVERHDRVGGYAHAFRRGRYLFDSAVHLVGGCGPGGIQGGGPIHRLLGALGESDRLDFARIDPCYTAVYPDLELRVPSDLEEFARVHIDEFPAEAKGLRQVLQECLNIRQEMRGLQGGNPFEVMKNSERFPTLLRYRRATLRDVLDEHIDSDPLKSLLGTLWPYVGLPPSRVSFLYFANMLMSYVADGSWYCRGSFQRFAETLAGCVTRSGGEVLLRSPVRRILVENGRARGVVLENGQRIAARHVLSNADARQTLEELVGEPAVPARTLADVRAMKPSLSAFVVYAATDLPLDETSTSHESFFYSSWDHDDALAGSRSGSPDWLSVTVPTLADPSLAPPGEHVLILTTLVGYGAASWRSEKHPFARTMVERASRHLEVPVERLRILEAGTPRTMERYTRNTEGATYGWELSPAQVATGRLAPRTPVEGLHLVGHWTQPGGGVVGVVGSGIQAARTLLGHANEADLFAALRSAGR